MSARRGFYTWGDTGAAIQLQLWCEKLDEAHGNITEAGRLLGVGKRWAMKLTRLHGLTAYAAELRKAAIGRSHGRPPVG